MIKAIMACDEKMGIGKNGTLPWPANKEDLKYFKEMTTGHIVIMGSGTWNDPCFPAPLKNRKNYVISSNKNTYNGAITISGDIVSEIKELSKNEDVWIIGGANVIKQCFEIIDEFYLTKISGNYKCDKFIQLPMWFKEESRIVKENTYLKYINTSNTQYGV